MAAMASTPGTTTGLAMAMAITLLLAVAADEPPPADGQLADTDEGGRLRRVSNFVKSYAIRQGAGMVTTDDDVKCLVQAGQALSNEKQGRALTAPVLNAMRVVMHTTPHCKMNVLAKGRMFLSPDFLRGLGGAVFGKDSS